MSEFYNKFILLCNEKGVSPTNVAKAIGISTPNVTYWKNGSIPKGETLQKLAAYFGISVGSLLGEEKERVIIPGRLSFIEINREDAKNIQYKMRAADREAYEIGLKIFADAGVDIINVTPRARLDAAFDKLNDDGQQKAVERLEELAEIPRYQKSSDDQGSNKMQVAAHGGGVHEVPAPNPAKKQKIERLTKEALDESFDEDEEF